MRKYQRDNAYHKAVSEFLSSNEPSMTFEFDYTYDATKCAYSLRANSLKDKISVSQHGLIVTITRKEVL